jgi:hypothetical protein
MEQHETIELLETIEQQVSSSILGGREADYEELEALGYIKIDRDDVQWSAAITPLGRDFLSRNY